MSRRLAIALSTVAVLGGVVAPAWAGGSEEASTTLGIYTFTVSGEKLFVLGKLKSSDKRCLADRKIKVAFKKDSGGTVPIDNARSSDNGGWLATNQADKIAPQGPFSALIAKAAERRVRVGNKTLVCKADKLSYPLAD